MTRKGIIKEVAERTGANSTVTGFVVEETIKVIAESLCRGEAVYLRGLFSLTPVVRKKKLARNITKGSKVIIPEHMSPHAKFCKEIREKMWKLPVK